MLGEQRLSRTYVLDRDFDLRRPSPITPPPVWKAIFDDLQGKLLSGVWDYGERIPSERQLAEDYGVARPTVREAIRALAGEGLIEIQRSNSGGALVSFPTKQSVEESVEEFQRKLPEFIDNLDSRIALETFAARRAATKRTQGHIKAMHESVQKMEEAASDLQKLEKAIANVTLLPEAEQDLREKIERAALKYRHADVVFHRVIAVAARIPTLFDLLTRLRNGYFTTAAIDLLEGDGSRRKAVIREHESVLTEIRKHEKHPAADRMREHLVAVKRSVSKWVENPLERKIVSKRGSRELAAREVRDVLRETQVFVLGQAGTENGQGVAEADDIFSFIDYGPAGEKRNIVPVFTRGDFIPYAIEQNEEWQGLPQSVVELEGNELLSKLDPDFRVDINPWTPLDFSLRVEPDDNEVKFFLNNSSES